MRAYVPGEQPREPGYIKINTNESPYPPSPRVVEALIAEAKGRLNVYPDPYANAVRDRLAERFGLSRENFLVGNGGDDILTIVTRCLAGEGDTIAYATPSYSLYITLAEIQGAKVFEAPFPADFSLPPELFGNPAKLTFITNPNAPSGTAVAPGEIRRLAESLDGVLVVDEAYADFAGDNCMKLVGTLPNLCVLRSFSKSFNLAGMRIGYLAAPEALIGEFAKAKDSYNVNRMSIAAASAALDDYDYMLACVAKVKTTKAALINDLTRLGIEVMPSETNFVWARPPAPGAAHVYEELKKRKILVRYWAREGLADFLRISIGTPEDSSALVSAIESILGTIDER
jgi:histidinol-phosphate aminotransferase